MLVNMLNEIIEDISKAVTFVLNMLPDTPFDWIDFSKIPGWSIVSYFIPIREMFTFMIYYVSAVGVWYLVRWALRVVRYIQ